jgi:protein TonB
MAGTGEAEWNPMASRVVLPAASGRPDAPERDEVAEREAIDGPREPVEEIEQFEEIEEVEGAPGGASVTAEARAERPGAEARDEVSPAPGGQAGAGERTVEAEEVRPTESLGGREAPSPGAVAAVAGQGLDGVQPQESVPTADEGEFVPQGAVVTLASEAAGARAEGGGLPAPDADAPGTSERAAAAPIDGQQPAGAQDALADAEQGVSERTPEELDTPGRPAVPSSEQSRRAERLTEVEGEAPEEATTSAGAPGIRDQSGAPASSPTAVGSEALPLDSQTAVAARATDLGRYFHEVEGILRQRWEVPRELVYAGAQGTSRVVIAVGPTGAVISRELTRKSGWEGLDQAALDAFPRKLPRPPPGQAEPLYLVFDFVQRDDWILAPGGG